MPKEKKNSFYKSYVKPLFKPLIKGLAITGAFLLFAPVWSIEGFPEEKESGWKAVKRYFKTKKANKTGFEYYKKARKDLEEKKKNLGIENIKKAEKAEKEVPIITKKNWLVEKYNENPNEWRQNIVNRTQLPKEYIDDIIEGKSLFSKSERDGTNELLRNFNLDIEMLQDARQVIEEGVEYKPKPSNKTSSVEAQIIQSDDPVLSEETIDIAHEVVDNDVGLEFASEVDYASIDDGIIDMEGATAVAYGDTLEILSFQVDQNLTDMGVGTTQATSQTPKPATPSQPA